MVGGWLPRGGRNTNRNIRFFPYDTLRIATNDFSALLGRGGYGTVFKGVLPDDGRKVAIKKLKIPYDEFLEMVDFMSHTRHVNLIQVIGCCVDNGEQLLVSEFAENWGVDEHLYGASTPAFDWERRAVVCIGTARGLSYLHEEINPRIIHCDVKPSNIVLDANFVPKIIDFDLFHFVDECTVYAKGKTHSLRGTYGYMDPCYIATGQLTDKADVYGFGVVMLEIITGRRPFDLARQQGRLDGIVDWVARMMEDGTVLNSVDPKLTHFPTEDVERFIHVALLCTQAFPKQRPSMFEVVYMLYGTHKSNHEISDMATSSVAGVYSGSGGIPPLPGWNQENFFCAGEMESRKFSFDETDRAFKCSHTISLDGRGGSTESREEPFDETGRGNSDSSVVLNMTGVSHNEGVVCSASAAAVAPVETGLASSSREDQICPNDLMRAYFERSMEKIMRNQVAKRSNRKDRTTIMTQTVVTNKSSGNMFKEAVYPPFLTGEYRSSRVLYSGRPPPL